MIGRNGMPIATDSNKSIMYVFLEVFNSLNVYNNVSLTSIHLSVQPKPVESSVDGGAQVQQLFNIECITEFTDSPLLNISFT